MARHRFFSITQKTLIALFMGSLLTLVSYGYGLAAETKKEAPRCGEPQESLLAQAAMSKARAASGASRFDSLRCHGCHTFPKFAKTPTLRSAQNGAWSDPNTWTPARLPRAGDVLLVGHDVTYDTATGNVDTIGIDDGGALRFASDRTTRLRVGTLQVMPGGTLEVGTEAKPIPAHVTAEIIIAGKPLDTSDDGTGVFDPEQWGTGLVGITGKIHMHGSPKAPTFVRLGKEPRSGDTSLTLAQPVSGWQAGDQLSLPDTRHLRQGAGEIWSGYVPQWEELSIAAISGNVITLSRPLRFDHPGARDANGVLEFLPHVANLSRNVVIRSETPSGTRGHVVLLERADVDIRYVLFRDLGRSTVDPKDRTTYEAFPNRPRIGTNQTGRYPLNIHFLIGPETPPAGGHQFSLIGNAVDGGSAEHGFKWGIVLRNSHFGLVRQNVVYNTAGAGIVAEDGNESYNEFIENFVMVSQGNASPRDNNGLDGSAFWFSGFNHIVRNNVAANGINRSQNIVSGSGFNFWWPAASKADTKIPLYKGADLLDGLEGKQYRLVNMQLMPLREFAGNEAYGAMSTGLVLWHLGTDGYVSNPAMAETVIRDFRGWHLWSEAFYGYPINRVTFDGFVVRGSSRAFGIYDYGVAWQSGDYWAENVTIRRADIQGMQTGICCSTNTPGTFRIENSYFRPYRTGFSLETLATPGTGAFTPPRKTEIRNTTFAAWPGQPLESIYMGWTTARGNTNTTQKDEVFVYSYQGNATDNVQVYYTQQATQNIAGGRAPCTATRPEIMGLVCPTGAPPADTGTPFPPTHLKVVH